MRLLVWLGREDYSRHPALRPSGQPSAVQIRSRRICRTNLFIAEVRTLPAHQITSLLLSVRPGTSSILFGWAGRITPGSCPAPFGPRFARSKSFLTILSNRPIYRGGSNPPGPPDHFVATSVRPGTSSILFGWAGRIRTSACQDQNLMPYRLATAQYINFFYLTASGRIMSGFPAQHPSGRAYAPFINRSSGDWLQPRATKDCQCPARTTVIQSVRAARALPSQMAQIPKRRCRSYVHHRTLKASPAPA